MQRSSVRKRESKGRPIRVVPRATRVVETHAHPAEGRLMGFVVRAESGMRFYYAARIMRRHNALTIARGNNETFFVLRPSVDLFPSGFLSLALSLSIRRVCSVAALGDRSPALCSPICFTHV